MYLLNILSFWAFGLHAVAQYTPVPRWGQAVAVVEDVLFLHGGKTLGSQTGYTYTSAPTSNDLLFLPLNVPFAASSPPWTYISGSFNSSTLQGPTLAWHTLSAFNRSTVLVFGGDPGPNALPPILVLPDSAILLNVFNELVPSWTAQSQSWANEPIRRIHHSASSTGGKIWLVGGEKDDGSGNALSDHYVFDPNGPSFTLLPSTNGPPDLFGHTSIVLQDGRMIVFGGYCQSMDLLMPFTTIWVIDTTQSTLTWSMLFVSNSTLPSPRRAFAAIILDNGQVLIQGGADAVLQNVYSDGWILDVTQNPAVWTEIDVLTELGARYDHYAAPAASQVIFGGGYGPTSAAPASIQIYDPSSTAFVPSFTPPVTPNPTQTLPGLPQTTTYTDTHTNTGTNTRTATNLGPSGSSGTVHHGTGTSTHAPINTGTGTSDPGTPASRAKRTTVIAVGTAFGVMALIAGSIATTYYIKHQRSEATHDSHFHLLGGDGSEDGDGAGGSSDFLAAVYHREKPRNGPSAWFGNKESDVNPGVGLVLNDASGQRRDMLADEDTREFDLGSIYGGAARDDNGGSSWSMRSVGAALGSVGASVRGILSRENSGDAASFHRRDLSDPLSDALITTDLSSQDIATAYNRRQASYASTNRSYHDPFTDVPINEDIGEQDTHSDEADTDESTHLTSLASQTTLPPTPGIYALAPLKEQVSRTSEPTSFTSSQELPGSSLESNLVSSYTSYEHRPPRRSIVDSTPVSDAPLRRSDSWWSRFARTSFLERRASNPRSPPAALDFRDPNPAPRLVTIQEMSTHSHSAESPEERWRRRSQRRSVSSMQTSKTADSDAIERMGGMDVIQRVGTNNSHQTTTSTRGDTEDHSWMPARPLSVVASSGRSAVSHPPSNHEEADVMVESPINVDFPSSLTSSLDSSVAITAPIPLRPIPVKDSVLSRVRAYERRMSQDAEGVTSPGAPLSPTGRNTRKLEETSSRNRVTVNYGLAPRASLFVANPDHKSTPSSES